MGGTTPRCILACLAFALMISVSCGGGGGADPVQTEAAYTGLTTQAVLNRANVHHLMFYPMRAESRDPYILSAFVVAPGVEVDLPWLDIIMILPGALPATDPIRSDAPVGYTDVPAAYSVITSDSEVHYGDYGGTMTDSWTYDSETGDLAGELAYCDFSPQADRYMSGTVPYVGHHDTQDHVLSMEFTYRGFDLKYETSTGMLLGKIDGKRCRDWENLKHKGRDVSDLVITNITGNRTFKIEHAVRETRDFGDQQEHTFELRFYHHDYGYVDFATVEQLLYEDGFYLSGSIMVTGGPGPAGGPTRATFDFGSYLLRLDEDGDGEYEIDVQY